ncbi:MAG: hypothetical protein MI717_06335 [Spirochaetales bacterium]|nr:hypothetical protein [Spirochaetales bacterium]
MKQTLITLLLTVVALSLGAAEYRVVQVDLNWARSEISSLENRIASLEQAKSKDESRARVLADEDAELADRISRATVFLGELSANSGTLHGLRTTNRHPETRRRILESLEKNRLQVEALNNFIANGRERMERNGRERNQAQRRALADTVGIRDLEARIIWLEECIRYTESFFPGADSGIESSQELGGRVEQFLSESTIKRPAVADPEK